jgi:hypothetical protein
MTLPGAATRRDLKARLAARVQEDAAFLRALWTDPRAAVHEELQRLAPGSELPAELDIRVVQETATTLYVVLPPGAEKAVELADTDLLDVAGGTPLNPQPLPPGRHHLNRS